MTRKREVQAAEDLTGLPPPTQRHPMSGEPIWDITAVRALVERLRVTELDSQVLRVLATHTYGLDLKWLKEPNKITKLKLDVRSTSLSDGEFYLDQLRQAARDVLCLSTLGDQS